eukprot:292868-Rhodomonas_salina.1
MKQQRATKQASASKSKTAKADAADADSDPTVEAESVLPQNPVEITDLGQDGNHNLGEEIFIDFGHSIARGIHNERYYLAV